MVDSFKNEAKACLYELAIESLIHLKTDSWSCATAMLILIVNNFQEENIESQ